MHQLFVERASAGKAMQMAQQGIYRSIPASYSYSKGKVKVSDYAKGKGKHNDSPYAKGKPKGKGKGKGRNEHAQHMDFISYYY